MADEPDELDARHAIGDSYAAAHADMGGLLLRHPELDIDRIERLEVYDGVAGR